MIWFSQDCNLGNDSKQTPSEFKALEELYTIFDVLSNSQKHWYYHRLLLCLLKEEFANLVAHVFFDEFEIDAFHSFAAGILDGLLDDEPRLIQKLLRLADVDETSGDDVS